MAIEFKCSQCGQRLRVNDDAAGKQARCPSCGALEAIPELRAAPANRSGERRTPDFQPAPSASENPYESPVSSGRYAGNEVASVRTTTVDAGDILSQAWNIFQSEFWSMALVGFLYWLCQVGFGFIAGIAIPLALLSLRGGNLGQGDQYISQSIVQVVGFLFGTWLEAGVALYMLKAARGHAAGPSDLLSATPFWPAAIVARFLFFVAIVCGGLLFVIPGIIMALMLSQYLYLVVDRQQGAFESLRGSAEITTGNKLQLMLLALVSVSAYLIGTLACCIGVWPALAFVKLLWAVAYLNMTGQRTATTSLTRPRMAASLELPPELR